LTSGSAIEARLGGGSCTADNHGWTREIFFFLLEMPDQQGYYWDCESRAIHRIANEGA
jgi:hypothetical protein